jgi:hypothetical protein
MKVVRFSRLVMLVALLVCLIPASSRAAVFVSVGFAPPVLPVYVQPPCPEPGWMWTPGYWDYGPDGYYWVPGTWVPAPYVGALWTPGYWGWGSGLYVWHAGYWGPHVGYYGGVNYGFGYMGIGFAGGVWAGGAFRYNTAVMHVGPGIHNVYVDNTIVHNTTIINDRHVAFGGGPGGINHPPTADETRFSNERHMEATSFQVQHRTAAMNNRASYFNSNHGHPANAAMARPMSSPHGNFNNNNAAQHGNFNNNAGRLNNGSSANGRGNFTPQQGNRSESRSNNFGNQGGHPQEQMHESRPQPQVHESRPQPQQHEQPHGGGHENDHDKGH